MAYMVLKRQIHYYLQNIFSLFRLLSLSRLSLFFSSVLESQEHGMNLHPFRHASAVDCDFRWRRHRRPHAGISFFIFFTQKNLNFFPNVYFLILTPIEPQNYTKILKSRENPDLFFSLILSTNKLLL
jgi:hypothetical protein